MCVCLYLCTCVCAEEGSPRGQLPLDGLWVFSRIWQQAEVFFGCTEAEMRAQDSYREPQKNLYSPIKPQGV